MDILNRELWSQTSSSEFQTLITGSKMNAAHQTGKGKSSTHKCYVSSLEGKLQKSTGNPLIFRMPSPAVSVEGVPKKYQEGYPRGHSPNSLELQPFPENLR